jgi:hypothetical protein
MKKFFILLVLPLVSCANFTLDPTFSYYGSDEGFADAQVAAREWDICGANITITRTPGYPPMVEQVHITGDPADKLGGEEYDFEGPLGKYSKRIELRSTDAPSGLTTVIAHELGHALGLGHVAYGVMKPGVIGFEQVSLYECHNLWVSQGEEPQ